MLDRLNAFFAGDYAPHGYCLMWHPGLIWTHVISDALIAAAYFSIPIALITFVRKRRDVEFGKMFWLFAIFIMSCGLTHVMGIWNLWHGDYAAEATIKAITAAASVPTAILLWPLLPRALAIPSPSMLQKKNDEWHPPSPSATPFWNSSARRLRNANAPRPPWSRPTRWRRSAS